MTNKYDQECEICGKTVLAGEGELEKGELSWNVYHTECREEVAATADTLREKTDGMKSREMKKLMRAELSDIQERLEDAEQARVDAINAIEDSAERLRVSNGGEHPAVDQQRETEQEVQAEYSTREKVWLEVIYN